jgi:hypothetical protein
MTFTIWSNAGKFEWIMYCGDTVLDRSGLVFKSHNAAFRALLRMVKELS